MDNINVRSRIGRIILKVYDWIHVIILFLSIYKSYLVLSYFILKSNLSLLLTNDLLLYQNSI